MFLSIFLSIKDQFKKDSLNNPNDIQSILKTQIARTETTNSLIKKIHAEMQMIAEVQNKNLKTINDSLKRSC